MIGKHLSHYLIESELGRGGMGIVYRAQDTKLDRTVAIKVLPSAALSSEDDRARFYREAKAAAQLHHQHIAGVFEIDEAVPEGSHSDDLRPFIAMEYIKGETLEERIAKGPFKLDEAVRIAIQVASGLELAHEKGIVHRDIKSANIILSEKSDAKILDFGLAQTAASTKLTQLGSTLGTAAYMSPEQARGEAVDGRSDIWALGVILYEMISGTSPFPGDYEQAVVYAILNQDPEPLTAVRTGVPMELERITAKCLSKGADSRYQGARDLIVDLGNVDAMGARLSSISVPGIAAMSSTIDADPDKAEPRLPSSGRRMAIMAAFVVLLTAAGVVIGAQFFSRGDAPPVSGHFSIEFPEGAELSPMFSYERLAFSPDGRFLAYTSGDQIVDGTIYLRGRDEPVVQAITSSSEFAADLFFSPDGGTLGYVDMSSGLFKAVAIPDGSPRTLGPAKATLVVGVTWGPDDQIVYGDFITGLTELSADGSSERELTRLDTLAGERTHRFPHFIDGTSDLLFTVGYVNDQSWDQANTAHYSSSTGAYKIILQGARSAQYVSTGHIVYGRGGSLFAVAFDKDSATVTGNPVRLVEAVAMSAVYGRAYFSIDDSGTLAYVVGGQREDPTKLNWYSRAGELVEMIDSTRIYQGAQLSPDNSQILLHLASANDQVWLYDRVSGQYNPFTVEGNNLAPTWSADGKSITYLSSQMGGSILNQDLEKNDPPQRLTSRAGSLSGFSTWSPSGKNFVHIDINEAGYAGLRILNPSAATTSVYDVPGANVVNPSISPDGRWIVFASNELGEFELYAARFPSFSDRSRITSGGGIVSEWNSDGTELFYWRDMELVSVPVGPDGRPASSGTTLFSLENEGVQAIQFDHDSQTDQFLVVLKEGEPLVRSIDVVLNWFDVLERKMEEAKKQ